MELPLTDGVYTSTLTNSSLALTESMGVKKISVFNTTSTAGTILGAQNLGASTPSAINIAEDKTVVVTTSGGSVLKDLTVTAPVGCTLNIIALV
jgi:hypothetical protein